MVCGACGQSNKETPSTYAAVPAGATEVAGVVCESEPVVIEEQPVRKKTYVAVDLGLRSGAKWATMNVGARKYSDPGDYFKMGDTEPFDPNRPSKLCEIPLRQSVTVGGNPEYDASTANWGETWKMPTDREFYELQTACAWHWTEEDGHNGYRVIGPNGNSIFMPAAGYKESSNGKLIHENTDGYFWKAPLRDIIWFSKGEARSEHYSCGWITESGSRSDNPSGTYGLSVRPITYSSYAELDINESDIDDAVHGRACTLTKTGEIAGHQYVDLGLPSGTKWATMNIGATHYFDYGSGFEWGAIDPENPSHGKNLGENISGNAEYDAATAMWGEQWRLPTKEEIKELIDKCRWTTSDMENGVAYVAVGPNGNILVFPKLMTGRSTDIWSGTPYDSDEAYCLGGIHAILVDGVVSIIGNNNKLRIRPVSN